MHNTSTAGDRHTDRRLVLKAGAALAAAGPAALRGGHAEASPAPTAKPCWSLMSAPLRRRSARGTAAASTSTG